MTDDVAPNRAQRRSAWPKRRQWLERIAKDRRLTSGAKAWLLLLASRSDDEGKPVWGGQEKTADQLGRCSRSVRRYLVEAVKLGGNRLRPDQYPARGPRRAIDSAVTGGELPGSPAFVTPS